ncbi:MAG: hypothetical protein OCD02_16690 [Spirochaetaceae bacterium]
MKIIQTIFIIGLTFTIVSCNKSDYSHYIDSNNPNKAELENLFPLLETFTDYSENRFTVMSEIITKMLIQESPGKLNLLITSYVYDNPDDKYNSYYLLNLASYYLKNSQNDFAIPYLHRVIMDYYDLTIRGDSTHFKALEILVKISDDSTRKVFYYKKLIRDHKERIEKRDIYPGGIGEIYYYLAETLEQNERWEESIEAYEGYLESPDTVIPSNPEARLDTVKKVGFFKSDKKWVEKELETLVSRVKYALSTRNSIMLDKYRAFDFFIINWNSNYSSLESKEHLESYVLTNMKISPARNLDAMSNESEAFLSVSGNPWSNSIWYVYPTWYFYFKKVDFPQDPEIHGGWEWAGIFLGEKL